MTQQDVVRPAFSHVATATARCRLSSSKMGLRLPVMRLNRRRSDKTAALPSVVEMGLAKHSANIALEQDNSVLVRQLDGRLLRLFRTCPKPLTHFDNGLRQD